MTREIVPSIVPRDTSDCPDPGIETGCWQVCIGRGFRNDKDHGGAESGR